MNYCIVKRNEFTHIEGYNRARGIAWYQFDLHIDLPEQELIVRNER